ncbi:transcriptional regulator, LysR family protein [Roseobacter sp. SK209-2-6]|uniref:LysR substrate-binding domain-containing protein n=1 Tax=Roseobacter sp. SK209-2-6 TaxID=388739 RepID=UPI0000F3EF31|nr:LysR substrate-binding domain-containing protein [Roseobacter sp. SK209-2-6]EBA15516.1 transcriptional regulator, LysR family protein [Roseobacter sp. SK209-2-6]
MDDRLANLTWLRTFETAARLLNFTETGRELGLTQTAVSLHIRSLEARLGSQLFYRNARHLELTEIGQAYALTVRQALGDISLSTRRLFGAEQAQTLTVRVPVSTSALWLAHLLPEFSKAHPEINIRLVSNIWAEPEPRDEVDADVEIRLGRGDWEDVTAVQLSEETIVPVGSAAAAKPGDIAALLQGPHIHILGYEDHWARYFAAHDLTYMDQHARFSVDTTVAALQLVAGGGGYATVLTRFAWLAISTGMPLAIAGPEMPFQQSHYLIRRHGRKPLRPEVQLFEAWLAECFTGAPDRFGGEG